MSYLIYPPTVLFNGNDLNQVPGLVITSRNVFQDATRNFNSQKLARTDKSILTSAEYTNKQIPIEIAIVRDSRQALENSVDILNSLIQDIEGTLDITQNGQTRRYYATLQSSVVNTTTGSYNAQGAIGGFFQKTLLFDCSDPFGYDLSPTTLINALSNTAATATIQMQIGGSFKVAPIFTISLTAGTGITGGNMQIINSQTGLGITIARDFAVNDTISIAGDTGIVTVNGAIFNATGKIPLFLPGLRQVGYVDNFTTRTVLISAVATNKYL